MAKAEELAAAHGYTMIPPYDDPAIIAGQGTCGLEIVEQLGRSNGRRLVISPVSGGGLLSGIAVGGEAAERRDGGWRERGAGLGGGAGAGGGCEGVVRHEDAGGVAGGADYADDLRWAADAVAGAAEL
jgi:hypothetical protein